MAKVLEGIAREDGRVQTMKGLKSHIKEFRLIQLYIHQRIGMQLWLQNRLVRRETENRKTI